MSSNKQLQFVKSSAILILSNLILKGINFLLLPLYTKYLSPSELGISDTITSVTSVIFPLLVLGLDSAFSAFYFDEKNLTHRLKVFKTVEVVLLVSSIIPLIIALASNYISTILFNTNEYGIIVGVSLVTVSMNLWYLPFSLFVRMENRMTLFAIINIVASLSMIFCNIFLLSIFQIGVYALILSSAIVQLIQLLFYLRFSKIKFYKSRFDKTLLKHMLKYSLPLLPTVLASWVLNLSDRYILLYYCDEFSVGLYGIAARFGTAISLFANGVYMSYTTYAYGKKDDEDAQRQYSRILNAFSVTVLFICFIVSTYGREIISIMTESSYQKSYYLLIPILYSQLFYGMNTIVGYAMGFEKKSYYNFIATGSGAALNVILNIVFIPKFEALAAAYSTVISFAFMMLLTYFFAQKLYYVDYHIKKLGTTIITLFILNILIQSLPCMYKTIVAFGIAIICAILYKDILHDYIRLVRTIPEMIRTKNEKK